MSTKKAQFYWNSEALIVVGLFTALSKVISLMITVIGGGMNPVTILLKNGLATALLVVMVAKVRKFGILALYTLVSQAIGFLMTGGGMSFMIPFYLLSALISDTVIALTGGYKRLTSVLLGVMVYDLLGRVLTLSFSYLTVRENIGMFWMAAAMIALSYPGCLLIGLPFGAKFVKELRHAGIIREV